MRTIYIHILYDNGVERQYVFDSSEELTHAEMEIAVKEFKDAYITPAFRGEKPTVGEHMTFESEGRDINVNLSKVSEIVFSIR
ncbi:hypothetical protein QWJ34_07200 [Saccharibacillus sp. CPCC 101409]|uniref:hypothetical protein n=1 Tax=Saccharibacillus sp. CPCC 101409 TaxID=3058041 RepID=UPI0026729201|nr:hypothetical protein [Saccharibacillus sp. CPCC 101409]MDO3409546.1 hypothetical protein [Saccharibacillus sp. CPCC 101409]